MQFPPGGGERKRESPQKAGDIGGDIGGVLAIGFRYGGSPWMFCSWEEIPSPHTALLVALGPYTQVVIENVYPCLKESFHVGEN